MHHVRIGAPVGRGGQNLHRDVTEVQDLLNAHRPIGVQPLVVDGVCGPLTEAAVLAVQREVLHSHHPDGRIDPWGPTLRALNASRKIGLPAHSEAALTPALPSAPHPALEPASKAHPHAESAVAGRPRLHGARSERRVPPAEVVAAARGAQTRWKVPASITIAQWMIESGWGRHMPAGSNNPFGIKAARHQIYVLARTREEVNGRSVYIEAKFRKFGSLDEAFDQHGKLLAEGPAFAQARTHLNDPDGYADALTHHYATDSRYGSILKGEMRTYNLYQYNT